MEQPKSNSQRPNRHKDASLHNRERRSLVTIRNATAEDLVSVFKIEHDAPAAAHWKHSEYEKALNDPERLFLVAAEESDQQVIGFLVAWTGTDEWELENIVVSETARRRGIGRALMRALIEQALHRGAAEIRQELRASNTAAQSLGRSVGFFPEGRRKGYYSQPAEDALLFKYLFAGHRIQI